MKKCRTCGCELADDARFCSTCGTASGRPDSQTVLGTHVDDSGNESFINRFNLSQKKIGLGLTALAGLVIILAAVTGPSTDPILKFVGTWMFLGGFVWLIVVAVRRGQKRYAALTMTAGLIVAIVGTTLVGSAPGTGGGSAPGSGRATTPGQSSAQVKALSEDEKSLAIAGIMGYSAVRDAAIIQKGEHLSLVVIVAYGTNFATAKELGANFVRMVKTFGPDQAPGANVGTGLYDYQVGVYYPDKAFIVQGWKLGNSSKIRW